MDPGRSKDILSIRSPTPLGACALNLTSTSLFSQRSNFSLPTTLVDISTRLFASRGTLTSPESLATSLPDNTTAMADPKSGPHGMLIRLKRLECRISLTSLPVVVTLRDVDHRDPIPTRSVVLRAPAWQVKIGRGTQSGNEGLIPTQENAWFDSRVMSRSHALLLADPASQVRSLVIPSCPCPLTATRNCLSKIWARCMVLI